MCEKFGFFLKETNNFLIILNSARALTWSGFWEKRGFFREFELYFENIGDIDLKLFFRGDAAIRRFGTQKSIIFKHISRK